MNKERIRLNSGNAQSEVVELSYDTSKTPVKWDCELGAGLKPMLKEYFESEMEFHVPESQQIDDYRTEKKRPVDDPDCFNAALNTMKANIGIERF